MNGGSGLQTETYLSVVDLLEMAEEMADDDDVLYHIRSAQQQQIADTALEGND